MKNILKTVLIQSIETKRRGKSTFIGENTFGENNSFLLSQTRDFRDF